MPRCFARSTGKRYAFNPKNKLPTNCSSEFSTNRRSHPQNNNNSQTLFAKEKVIPTAIDSTKCSFSKVKLHQTKNIKSPEIDSGAESDDEHLVEDITNKKYHHSDTDDSVQSISKEPNPDEIESKYSCTDCGKSYSTQSNLSRHKQIHRSPNDKKAKTCPDCGKVYVSIPAYSMHVRTHNQSCVCPICSSSFSRPWLLQGHLRTHTGERPYKCQVCHKDFADRSNLRAHKQTHSQVKPYQCELCNKRFALKSYLSKHRSTVCIKRM